MNPFLPPLALLIWLANTLLVSAQPGPLPEVTVTTVEGQTLRGALQRLSAAEVKLEPGETVPVADLLRLEVRQRDWPASSRQAMVFLANGDQLLGRPVSMKDEAFQMAWTTFTWWESASIPLETVRALVLNAPQTRSAQQELVHQLLTTSPEEDEVVLQNGDRLRGELTDLTSEQVTLQTSTGEAKLPTKNVVAVQMSSELISFPPAEGERTIVQLRDDSRLTVKRLAMGEDGVLSCEATAGMKLALPVREVRSLQFLGGRAVYLSDLKPESYTFTPWLSREWELATDQNVTGGPLRLGDTTYARGLGMHSRSEVVFGLGGEYQSFQAVVGIDPQTRGRGSVVFRVEVDDQPVFASEEITGLSPPLTLPAIELQGKQKLKLIVEFGQLGDILDHANWCDAVLIRPPAAE